MSWQLGAFAILGLALAGGFAWYERARPDARIIALVATLAAFAALGRIAFAAVPNVKPTTDIVLISGYALGGGPGFVVGALAGLTSNFFFGQGPWTPWQMAAWGGTGMLGAGLAVVTHRRIGRWPLALACTVVGFTFTAIQDVGDWVNYSAHTTAQLGIYVGKGIGFDFVHAAGCLVFALAFGPSLTRSIQRFATRVQVTWRPADVVAPAVIAAAVLSAALVAGLSGPVSASAASTPTSYLLAAQNSDGGLGPSPGQQSSQLDAGWAALGLAADGINPVNVRHGGASLIDYVRTGVGSQQQDVGSLERTILIVSAAGLRANSFGGQDLIAGLERNVQHDGSVSGQVNLTSFAVLALRAAGVSPQSSTITWLEHQQGGDGGFNFATGGGSSDVDDTGAALEALAGTGATGTSRAVAFIRAQQNSDGGFPAQPGGDSNAQSTAWAVQGLLAAGSDPSAVRRASSRSPLQYLSSLIATDGHVQYSRSSDQTPVWVTAQAAMALARKALPLAPAPSPSGHGRSTHRIAHAATRAAPASPRVHRVHHRRVKPRQRAMPSFDALAAAAGIAVALALAPIGQG
jgi:energy-coupling factor transport system substrate-specific component